jgi:hypothetical protein
MRHCPEELTDGLAGLPLNKPPVNRKIGPRFTRWIQDYVIRHQPCTLKDNGNKLFVLLMKYYSMPLIHYKQ